jgi:hypothetical protein
MKRDELLVWYGLVWFGVCTWLDVAEDLVHIVQILGPGAAHADDVIADPLMQLADHFLALPKRGKTHVII